MLNRRLFLMASGSLVLGWPSAAVQAQSPDSALDHNHASWDALLKKHVRWLPDNKQSQVDYKAFAADRAGLQQILARWSAVTPAQFAGLSREQKMAFLINAYNGFTIELILTQYPNLKSIKDLGTVFQSPWKKKFFRLLGDERHLDWIEHEQLRPGYNDWRVHAAVNCASIGCPALRSEIFKWFGDDFQKGHRGIRSLNELVVRYADGLGVPMAERATIRAGSVRIRYLDYNWSLNDMQR